MTKGAQNPGFPSKCAIYTTIKTEKAVFIIAFSVLKNEVSGLEHAKKRARIKTTSKCCFYRKRRSFVNKQASVSEAWRIYKTSDRSEVSKRKEARAYEARPVSKRKRDGSIAEKSRRCGADFFTKNQANLVAFLKQLSIKPKNVKEYSFFNIFAGIARKYYSFENS